MAADQWTQTTLGCRQLLLWYQLNLTHLWEGTQHICTLYTRQLTRALRLLWAADNCSSGTSWTLHTCGKVHNTSVHCIQGSWPEHSGYSGLQTTAPLWYQLNLTHLQEGTIHLYTVHKAADQRNQATLGCRQLLLWYQLNLTHLQEGTQYICTLYTRQLTRAFQLLLAADNCSSGTSWTVHTCGKVHNTFVHCTQGSWPEHSGYSGLQTTVPLVPVEPYKPVGRYTTHLYIWSSDDVTSVNRSMQPTIII